jgi:hypothetical protein
MWQSIKRALRQLRVWLSEPPAPSPDPEAGVREPRPRRPSGRTTAVAVAEPDE